MKTHTKSGFTLIETLVAILIMSIAVASLFQLIAGGLVSARYAKNDIIAFYLAQEGVDFIRNDRDTDILVNGGKWSDWIAKYSTPAPAGPGCFDPQGCLVDSQAQGGFVKKVFACDFSGCKPLEYYSNPPKGSFYGYQSNYISGPNWTTSPFIRTVTMAQDTAVPDELLITSTVSWSNGLGVTRSKVIKTSLWNWQSQ